MKNEEFAAAVCHIGLIGLIGLISLIVNGGSKFFILHSSFFIFYNRNFLTGFSPLAGMTPFDFILAFCFAPYQ